MSAVAAPELRDISGPSATAGGLARFAHLTWTIGLTEFRLSYFGSALGYLWSLMRPLFSFAVLLVVFTKVFHAGRGVPHYAVMLLLGVVFFTFFVDATSGSVAALVNRESLVRKMQFPRLVIPLSVVLTATFNLAVNLVPVLAFALASGVRVRATWLLVPLVLIGLVAFASGVAMALSALYVRFRDVSPIWAVVSQVLLYGSAVMYTVGRIPEGWRHVVLANPLASLIQLGRTWLVDPGQGTPGHVLGGGAWNLLPLGVGLAVLAFGLWIFDREAPGIAERL